MSHHVPSGAQLHAGGPSVIVYSASWFIKCAFQITTSMYLSCTFQMLTLPCIICVMCSSGLLFNSALSLGSQRRSAREGVPILLVELCCPISGLADYRNLRFAS